MKRILKSFRQALLSEDNSSIQSNEKPQGKPECKGKKTADNVSVKVTPSQNNIPSVKPKVKCQTLKPKEAVEADKAECFPQRQLYRDNCRLFLGGLPDNIAPTEVKKVFENYGRVIDVVIPFDRDTNKPKRYGYMEFENESSAKACLDDRFVTVCGRRVEIKKAWPRNAPRKKENCDKKENKETGDHEKYLSCPPKVSSSESVSSAESASNMENKQLLYQKLFEDYFKAKFFLQNLLDPGTASNAVLSEEIKSQRENQEKVEEILKSLYITTKEDSSEEEDNEDLSEDTDDTYSTFEESEYSFHDLAVSTTSDQTKNIPSFMKDAERKACSLCKWAPLDNSSEGFLVHCKTLGHKQKLRERFKKSETPDNSQNKTPFHANPRNNNRNKQNYQKKKKINQRKEPPSKNEKNQSGKKEGKLVLEEIISSVEAKTEKCIKCKICNKTIPQAADIRILMANLSNHLQSKGHLARISDFEKSREKSENVPAKEVKVKVNRKHPLQKKGTNF